MKIEHLSDHNVSQLNCYVFDTNIWLYIYGPMAGSQARKQRNYSNLLREILDRNAGLFITSLILSEYINRFLRICFDQWKSSNKLYNADYKSDYRPTPEFANSLSDVKAQVHDILSSCTARMPDDFNIMDIDSLVDSISQQADYNDIYLVRRCERKGFWFVSDDTDIESIPSGSLQLLKE